MNERNGAWRLAALIAPFALLHGCVTSNIQGSQKPDGGESCGITQQVQAQTPGEIVHQQYSGMTEPSFSVVRTAREWHSVWERICKSCQDFPPGDVDFSNEMLIVAGLGESSGAYLVFIDHVAVIDGRVEIAVRREVLGAQCVITMAKM